MLKVSVYLLIITLGILIIGELGMAEEKKPKLNEVQILLYQKGKQTILDNQSPHFQELLLECENLLKTANSKYKLIVTKELLSEIKKGVALEIIYLKVKTAIIPFNQQTIYFSKLLIPLTGRFSNGTVFFAGISEYELKRDNPDLLPEQSYDYIDVYRTFNFVLNTKGLSKLKETLKKMSIKID